MAQVSIENNRQVKRALVIIIEILNLKAGKHFEKVNQEIGVGL